MTAAWFIVWPLAGGTTGELGPFAYRHTCEAAIANARGQYGDGWAHQDDWRLPSNAACVERRR
jgi:hypothetical protein